MRKVHPIVSNPELFTPKFIFNRILDATYNYKDIIDIRSKSDDDVNDIDMHLTNAFAGREELYWWMNLETLSLQPTFNRGIVPHDIEAGDLLFVGTGTNETNVRVAF